jgi:hypothetical protein
MCAFFKEKKPECVTVEETRRKIPGTSTRSTGIRRERGGKM